MLGTILNNAILEQVLKDFQITPLNFLPIEPPRGDNASQETYARRQHQFTKPGAASKTKSLFQKFSGSVSDLHSEPPRISADARLPNPSILTCNEPIPLRVLVKKLSDTSESIFLQTFQIELIASTHILAHDLSQKETGSWVIFSRSNMGVMVGKGTDPADTEWPLDARMWNQLPLPNSVAPSFETCNVSRTYELEVRIGLSHGSIGNVKVCPTNPAVYRILVRILTMAAATHRASIENASEGLLWNCSAKGPFGSHG